jgi:DNA repair protein RecN (Recombination protein N)
VINHFFVKEYLSFEEAQLHFKPGLVVFTGPSGSGKSILLNALLGTTAQYDSQASLAEVELNHTLDLEEYGLESDDYTTFKQLKKGNTRFFVNNQSISKKILQDVSSKFIRHLSHKDFSDFAQKELLAIVDKKVSEKDNLHEKALENFREHYKQSIEVKKALDTIYSEEKRLLELKEYAQFELEKIDKIAPKLGEDEELDSIKKRLAQRDKIEDSVRDAAAIFEFEHKVSEALSALDVDSSFFDEAMNELRVNFDSADDMVEELESLDIESILDRIEAISELKRRYGSIEEALAYRDTKAAELHKYENFDENKERLEKEHEDLQSLLMHEADALHVARIGVVKSLETTLNEYTKALYLRDAHFGLDMATMNETGVDAVVVDVSGSDLQQLSSGEFNRLRLALLALRSDLQKNEQGILILDEIDANLSGEESMSVAHVLTKLASQYQIFAISHQPQLTSQAHQHFMVYKEGDASFVKDLNDEERINEIARMISGDHISEEAKQFAITLRSA